MELDITAAFYNLKPRAHYLSGSQAELGQDAGRITWENSKDAAEELPILNTDEKREAFRDFVRDSGGWSRAEIAAWSDHELNALCLQWIAGDIRESRALDRPRCDWRMYQRDAQACQNPGRFFCANRRVYFELGT